MRVQHKQHRKRLGALLLAVLMVVTLLPAIVLAALPASAGGDNITPQITFTDVTMRYGGVDVESLPATWQFEDGEYTLTVDWKIGTTITINPGDYIQHTFQFNGSVIDPVGDKGAIMRGTERVGTLYWDIKPGDGAANTVNVYVVFDELTAPMEGFDASGTYNIGFYYDAKADGESINWSFPIGEAATQIEFSGREGDDTDVPGLNDWHEKMPIPIYKDGMADKDGKYGFWPVMLNVGAVNPFSPTGSPSGEVVLKDSLTEGAKSAHFFVPLRELDFDSEGENAVAGDVLSVNKSEGLWGSTAGAGSGDAYFRIYSIPVDAALWAEFNKDLVKDYPTDPLVLASDGLTVYTPGESNHHMAAGLAWYALRLEKMKSLYPLGFFVRDYFQPLTTGVKSITMDGDTGFEIKFDQSVFDGKCIIVLYSTSLMTSSYNAEYRNNAKVGSAGNEGSWGQVSNKWSSGTVTIESNSITLTKYDDAGAVITTSPATFTITRYDSTGTAATTGFTSGDYVTSGGSVTAKNLIHSAGDYFGITEKTAPAGYTKYTGTVYFQFSAGGATVSVGKKHESTGAFVADETIYSGAGVRLNLPAHQIGIDNVKDASSSTTTDLDVGIKTVMTAEHPGETFAFTLTEVDDDSGTTETVGGIKAATTVTIGEDSTASEKIIFENLALDTAKGIYYFIVAETNDGKPGWSYDGTKYIIKVEYSTSTSTWWADRVGIMTFATVVPAAFENTYTPVYDAALQKWVVSTGSTLTAPDSETVVNKAAPQVSVGDKVVFGIKVINQCDEVLKITEIADYMPEGYAFNPAEQTGHPAGGVAGTWSTSDGKTILFTPTVPIELQKEGAGGDTAIVYLTLTVKAGATNATLRNFAEISGMTDVAGDPVVDVDSTFDRNSDNDIDGTVKDNEITEHRKDPITGLEDKTKDEDDHDYAEVILKTVIPPTTDDDDPPTPTPTPTSTPTASPEPTPPTTTDTDDDDDDDDSTTTPDGGTTTAPEPTVPPDIPGGGGGGIVPYEKDDGEVIFIQLDEDGTPLGKWVQNENGEWELVDLLEDEIPRGAFLPKTGSVLITGIFAVGTAMIAGGLVLGRKRKDDDEEKVDIE